MGVAASLFFRSNDPDAQTLLRRITPSSDQFDQQRDRWSELGSGLIFQSQKMTVVAMMIAPRKMSAHRS